MGHDTMQQWMARIETEVKQRMAQGDGSAAVDGPGRDGGAAADGPQRDGSAAVEGTRRDGGAPVDDPGRDGAGGGLSVTDAGRKLTSLKMSLLHGQIPVQ